MATKQERSHLAILFKQCQILGQSCLSPTCRWWVLYLWHMPDVMLWVYVFSYRDGWPPHSWAVVPRPLEAEHDGSELLELLTSLVSNFFFFSAIDDRNMQGIPTAHTAHPSQMMKFHSWGQCSLFLQLWTCPPALRWRRNDSHMAGQ